MPGTILCTTGYSSEQYRQSLSLHGASIQVRRDNQKANKERAICGECHEGSKENTVRGKERVVVLLFYVK